MGRSSHAAVCLGFGGDHPQLLVTGGVDDDLNTLNDVWTLDINSWRWREVRVCDCCEAGKHVDGYPLQDVSSQLDVG